MMERHFQKELESLKTTLIKMGSLVEGNLNIAIHALLEKKSDYAHQVIESDKRIDSLELEIDNMIVELLALQQPVAGDLRFIIAVQKINNNLERIGDHTVNIAESVLTLNRERKSETLFALPEMADITKSMLTNSFDGFIHLDTQMAKDVLKTDSQVDSLNRAITSSVIEFLKSSKGNIEIGLEYIRISRNLERIADLSTNIAEEVIFYTQARVVKHHVIIE